MKKIVPSIMCADPLNLERELLALSEAGIEWLHCDVMDGDYVNNMAMAPYNLSPIIKTNKFKTDIHLAVSNPEKCIPLYASLSPDFLTFHVEASAEPEKQILQIKEYGIGVGIALNPETAVEELYPYIEMVDLILMMTVNPGFAGQKFNHSVLSKLSKLNAEIAKSNNHPLIEVDGNIYSSTIQKIKQSGGADLYVVGTAALFNGDDHTYSEKISKLKQLI